MTIPNHARSIARQAYRHAMMTGQFHGTTGKYAHSVTRDCKHVVVRIDDANRWVVPVAKNWL